MDELMFKNAKIECLILEGVPYFNPYHVGLALGMSESTVRNHLSKMNDKQARLIKKSSLKVDFIN